MGEQNTDELGALWEKTGPKGPYMTGHVEIDGTKHAVVVFANGNRKNDKAPHWRVLKARPRPE